MRDLFLTRKEGGQKLVSESALTFLKGLPTLRALGFHSKIWDVCVYLVQFVLARDISQQWRETNCEGRHVALTVPYRVLSTLLSARRERVC